MTKLKWDSDDFNASKDQGGVSHRAGENLKQGYSHRQILRGLVGRWPLTYTSGDAKDLAGSNNGPINGSVTRGVAGKGGLSAYNFDGSDDYLGISSFKNFSAMTVSVWLNPDAINDGNNDPILRFSTNNEGELRGNGDGTVDCLLIKISGTPKATTVNVSNNTWTHLAGTWDSSTGEMYAYKNGSQVDSATHTTGKMDKAGFETVIGKSGQGSYLDGSICDLRVYDRQLSSAEVQMLYNFGNVDAANPPGNYNGGISYYNLNEGSGSTAGDSWGSNDGTLKPGSNGTTTTSGMWASDSIRGSNAVTFDGNDDLINLGQLSSIEGVSEMTLSLWVNAPSSTWSDTSKNHTFFSYSDDSSNQIRLLKQDTADGEIKWNVENGGTRTDTDAVVSYAADKWHHLVGVFKNSKGIIYSNGERQASSSGPTNTPSISNNAVLGQESPNTGWGGNLNGKLDEIRIYSRALKPHEIQQLYHYGTRGVDMNKHLVDQ